MSSTNWHSILEIKNWNEKEKPGVYFLIKFDVKINAFVKWLCTYFSFWSKKKKKFQTEQQLGKKIQQSHNYINY